MKQNISILIREARKDCFRTKKRIFYFWKESLKEAFKETIDGMIIPLFTWPLKNIKNFTFMDMQITKQLSEYREDDLIKNKILNSREN